MVFPICNAAHSKIKTFYILIAVKISFSQRYVLITFLFCNLIKEFWNNFVNSTYRILVMLNSH
jgi:hypothetical protein